MSHFAIRNLSYMAQRATILPPVLRQCLATFAATAKVTALNSRQRCDEAADLADVRRCLNGDSIAYRRLIQRHQAHVARLLWRFTRDRTEHEELVHQVFVDAYVGLRKFRAAAPLEHWLARIATRAGYAYWRRCKTAKQPLPDDLPETSGECLESAEQAESAALIVHHLLSHLPVPDRLVLTLRYLEQCDVQQTAYRTGWNSAVVRVRTHRALKRLRKLAIELNIQQEES